LVATILYAAPFILFFLAPPGLDAIFLAFYVLLIFASLAIKAGKVGSSIENDLNLYRGILRAATGLVVLSLFLLFLFGIMGTEEGKYVASTWIFLSLFFPLGAPISVARLGVLLRKDEPDALRDQFATRTGIQHFFVEYSTFRWYRHAYYFLIDLLMLSLYLYGWYLLGGTPMLLYSIGLLVFVGLVLSSLTTKLLAPSSPNEVIRRIESLYPVRTLTANIKRPSPSGLVIILSILTLFGYLWLVRNATVGFNLAVFSMLIVVYALSIWLRIWSISSQHHG
jgi:hypothetical protein